MHPPPVHQVQLTPPMVPRNPLADALAPCRAPTRMPIHVIVLPVIALTFLELIISLRWVLMDGMRSTRPKGQVLEDSFTVSLVFEHVAPTAAGAACGS